MISSTSRNKWVAVSLSGEIALSTGTLPTRGEAASGISAVWANDGGDKVTQDDLRVSARALNVTNSVWDGTQITLFGAKNEVVDFNLILEALNGSSNVSV